MRCPATLIGAILLACALCACAGPTNPSFPLSVHEANDDLARMRRDPVKPERPIVVLAGYADPGFATSHIRNRLRSRLRDPQVITVTFGDLRSFDEARRHLVESIERSIPSEEPGRTVEVDVIGNSMGGLIARDAAIPRDGERTLHIARLFTISTPHTGARAARSIGWTPLQRSMRPGSDFLSSLDNAPGPRTYSLIPYARTGDGLVGEENTAPRGEAPWWTPAAPFLSGHFTTYDDPRIMADILRRLRAEEPFTTEPRAPLPCGPSPENDAT